MLPVYLCSKIAVTVLPWIVSHRQDNCVSQAASLKSLIHESDIFPVVVLLYCGEQNVE